MRLHAAQWLGLLVTHALWTLCCCALGWWLAVELCDEPRTEIVGGCHQASFVAVIASCCGVGLVTTVACVLPKRGFTMPCFLLAVALCLAGVALPMGIQLKRYDDNFPPHVVVPDRMEELPAIDFTSASARFDFPANSVALWVHQETVRTIWTGASGDTFYQLVPLIRAESNLTALTMAAIDPLFDGEMAPLIWLNNYGRWYNREDWGIISADRDRRPATIVITEPIVVWRAARRPQQLSRGTGETIDHASRGIVVLASDQRGWDGVLTRAPSLLILDTHDPYPTSLSPTALIALGVILLGVFYGLGVAVVVSLCLWGVQAGDRMSQAPSLPPPQNASKPGLLLPGTPVDPAVPNAAPPPEDDARIELSAIATPINEPSPIVTVVHIANQQPPTPPQP